MDWVEASSLADTLGITSENIQRRLQALNLNEADRELLRDSWPGVEPIAKVFVEELYQRFRATPQLADLLKHESRIERLIALQNEYLRDLFCERIDRAYVQRRLKIGLVHQRIRVTPQWYLATYAHFICNLIDPLLRQSKDRNDGLRRVAALHNSILFDAALVLDAYGQKEDDALSRHRALLVDDGVADDQSDSPQNPSALEPRTSNTEPGMIRIRLNELETALRASFIGLTKSDHGRLRNLRQIVSDHSPAILQDFYGFIVETPVLNSLIRKDQIERLVRQVTAYWKEFVEGDFDRPYAASRMRIGVIHEAIGLAPQWYLVGLARQVTALLHAIPADFPDFSETIKSFFRALYFDITFVIDAYMESRAMTLLHAQGYANQLMAGLASAVVIVNSLSRIQFANKSFIAQVGIDPAQLYQMHLKDVLAIGELQAAFERLQRDKLRRVSCLGKWGDSLFRISVLRLEEAYARRQRTFAVIFDDVSDMVRLTESLEQDAWQYQRLANTVSGVLWEMDGATRVIHSISFPTIDLIGYRDVSMLGRPDAWQHCILPADRERFERCCQALRSNPHASCEYRMLRADGAEIWVRSQMSRMSSDQFEFGIAAVTVDITQVRQADQIRLNALEQVAGGAAHVINNALTVIAGNIELFKVARPSDESDPYLHEIVQAARRAGAIVARLQAFSRAQFLRPERCSLNDLIRNRLSTFQLLAGNIVQIVTLYADSLWEVQVDPNLLATAICHVCDNACEAMPSGGTFTIQTRNVEGATLPGDDQGSGRDWVEIRLSDTGVGMTTSVLQHAVEPFYSTSTMAEHPGLGLSMVHGFTAQSGGYLRLESSSGLGTTVILRFPPAALEQSLPSPGRQAVNKTTVLVVDEDEAVLRATTSLVGKLGYRVLQARNASSAIQLIAGESINLLLTEIMIGGSLDGLGLARKLKEIIPNLAVVITLGSGFGSMNEESLMEGWQLLEKPFSIIELKDCLQAALQSQSSAKERSMTLTARERQVLHWIAAGKSHSEVSMILNISERTVEQHVRNAKRKLNAVNTIQAVVEAVIQRQIDP